MSARRGRWIPWAVTGGIVLAGGAAAAFVVFPALEHRSAEDRYAEAQAAWQEAREGLQAEQTGWDAADARAQDALTVAAAVTPDAALPYLDADLVTEVKGAASDIEAAYDDVPDPVVAHLALPNPQTTDELIDAADELDALAGEYERAAGQYDDVEARVAELTPGLESAAEAVRASIPDAAAAVEEANISSTAQSRIRLHYAADAAATSDDSVEYYVTAYAEAAQAVEQSQADEMAEKDQGDGLIDARLEVEEFVRSITGGVRVDFDWAPIVNGLGDGDSAGGRVTWQYLDGGSATMELSNSVAANWPDSRYESLVAHESGHVITAKCQDMLVDTFEGDAELMATAWAIGMGYTDSWGNGVNFYYDGVAPTQDLVDATTGCR
ncbi:hypothetical protein GCM10010922_04910 [Microbacterium sorbitolivorans]|uniref:Uncharacterized protein n=1 Tax=Microbacterium sorbitolivorans TaxID=1867410 RepID=A0A367Y6A5_9MICO|nr:hypothetical protein [Microbacterium sorbitolivorans]RCK61367.1 hypothetical protein DTO57_01575 [Microbacterium sorbitolivorans]GGF32848.1 hypothetical protein GCM10010922_04910 [Microbacterium sorbitolivorans]